MPRKEYELEQVTSDEPTHEEPETESKSQRFVRLANARVNKALKAIEQIKHLSSPNYESTPEQRIAVFSALARALADAEKAFQGRKETEQFHL